MPTGLAFFTNGSVAARWSHSSILHRNVNLSALVVVATKAQTIDKEES